MSDKPKLRLLIQEDGVTQTDVNPEFAFVMYAVDPTDDCIDMMVGLNGSFTDVMLVVAAQELLRYAGYVINKAEGEDVQKARSFADHVNSTTKVLQEAFTLQPAEYSDCAAEPGGEDDTAN